MPRLKAVTNASVFEATLTSDSSTTELTTAEATIVAHKAAAIFLRNLAERANSVAAGRYDALASRYEEKYLAEKGKHLHGARIPRRLSYGWQKATLNTLEPGW